MKQPAMTSFFWAFRGLQQPAETPNRSMGMGVRFFTASLNMSWRRGSDNQTSSWIYVCISMYLPICLYPSNCICIYRCNCICSLYWYLERERESWKPIIPAPHVVRPMSRFLWWVGLVIPGARQNYRREKRWRSTGLACYIPTKRLRIRQPDFMILRSCLASFLGLDHEAK